jgi:hypothetical protein
MKPAFLMFLLLLAACARYSLVPPGSHEIGDAYTVQTSIAWSETSAGPAELWTVDGPSLEDPRFGGRMTASEVMEFVVDSLALAGAANVATTDLRPTKFGRLEGFRFELAFLDVDGLEYDGLAAGAVADEKLNLILYTGARAYYFPKYKSQVERLIASVRM